MPEKKKGKQHIACIKCGDTCCLDCNAIHVRGCGKFGSQGQGWVNYVDVFSTKSCMICKCSLDFHYFTNSKESKQQALDNKKAQGK